MTDCDLSEVEYDKLIQCYVEEDDPKSREELNALSAKELKNQLAKSTACYRFLVDDEIERIGCQN